MTDYISRAAAIEAMERAAYWNDAERKIKELHAIDIVPVVRCRDCIHAQKAESNERFDCLLLDCNNPESFYCMYGERRNDE